MPEIDQKRTKFLQRACTILKLDRATVEAKFSITHKSTLRTNPLKNTEPVKELIAQNHSDFATLPWCENAYIIEQNRSNYSGAVFFKTGHYYIQNASSLLPVLALNPQPNEVILDMCAAPGGKTLHIAELTQNSAYIYANDENKQRLNTVSAQAKLYGAKLVHLLNVPAQYLYKHTPQKFDKILIDAPCSGEGLINLAQDDALHYWSENKINRLSKLQKQIIDSAYKLLTPQGCIIYSTCTLAPEENEEIMSYALSKYADLKVEKFTISNLSSMLSGISEFNGTKYCSGMSYALRVIPNIYMEAFFVCKLVKRI